MERETKPSEVPAQTAGTAAMAPIGIIGAMENEAAALKAQLADVRTTTWAGMDFVEGTLAGKRVVIVRSGVGKVNAAVCVQVLADKFGVGSIVNTGVAGSLDARIDIGDIVVSTDAVHHDTDVTFLGYAPGQVPQMDAFSFPADEGLRAAALRAVASAAPDVSAWEGRVASGDAFVHTDQQKARIKDQFDALCCEMEGAAIAHASWLNGIPFVIVRAISDKADGSDSQNYQEFEDKAAAHCAHIVAHMVKNL